MKFIPRQDFVILQMDKPTKQSKEGILLSQTAVQDDRVPATVLAIGPGRMTEYGFLLEVNDIIVGDRVIFNKYSALELDEKERLYMIRGNDIGCTVDDD